MTAGIKISDKGILTLTKPVCMYFTSEKMKKINKKQIFSLKLLLTTYNNKIMIDTDLKHSACWFHNIPCEMKQLSWKRVSWDFVSGSSGASAHFILKLC